MATQRQRLQKIPIKGFLKRVEAKYLNSLNREKTLEVPSKKRVNQFF